MKTALITGATSGIGEATAHILAENNYRVIITGRRKEKLEALKQKLIDKHQAAVLALVFDVRNYKEVTNSLGKLPKEWQDIDVLINNAGLAVGTDTIDEGALEDWNQMIDTNIKGLLHVSKTILPSMKNKKSGHVINIASVAGKEVYLKGNVYCATKHAVDALSKAMRIDLLPHRIRVTNIAPGMVETEFSVVRYKGNKEKADEVYRDMKPLTGKDIAETIWFVINRPAHVNINDILIMPTSQANTSHLLRENF